LEGFQTEGGFKEGDFYTCREIKGEGSSWGSLVRIGGNKVSPKIPPRKWDKEVNTRVP